MIGYLENQTITYLVGHLQGYRLGVNGSRNLEQLAKTPGSQIEQATPQCCEFLVQDMSVGRLLLMF